MEMRSWTVSSKDQKMTKRWRNFVVSEKNRNTVGWEQQKQEQHNTQSWDEKVERCYFCHVGRAEMTGKSANAESLEPQWKRDAPLLMQNHPSMVLCTPLLHLFSLPVRLSYTLTHLWEWSLVKSRTGAMARLGLTQGREEETVARGELRMRLRGQQGRKLAQEVTMGMLPHRVCRNLG